RAFRGSMPWIYPGQIDARTFRRTVARKHYYQDVQLVADAALSGTLRVKDRGNWIELPVELTDAAAEDSASAPRADVALARYDTRLHKKQEEFDRNVQRELRHTHTRRDRMFTTAFAKA